jgi:hypothetical protein
MRLSSLVSLVVVTASLALGGCAADADQTAGEDTAKGEASLVSSKTADKAPAMRVEGQDSRLFGDHTISRTGGDSERTIKLAERAAVDVDGVARAHLNPLEAVTADSPLGTFEPGDTLAANNHAHAANDPVIAAGLPGADFGDIGSTDASPTRSRRDP